MFPKRQKTKDCILISSCSNCGRKGWLKITDEKRKGRLDLKSSRELTSTKKIGDWDGGVKVEKTVPIKRRSYPNRYLSLFASMVGVKTADNPPINPVYSGEVLQERSPAVVILQKSILEFSEQNIVLLKLLPEILKKYENDPIKYSLITEFNSLCDVMDEYLRTCFDDRYVRSWSEWSRIVKYANDTSANAASKRFYGIDSSIDKKIAISTAQIKKKMKKMSKESSLDVNDFLWSRYLPFAYFLMQDIIAKDPELLRQYRRISQEVDESMKHKNSVTNQNQNDYAYKYTKYKVIHYDQDLYKERKLDYEKGIRKSKPDGKIECRVKEVDLPSEVISYLKSSQHQPNNAAN